MHLITKVSIVATKVSTVATLFAASAAFAIVSQGNIESGKNIYMNGKGDVPACNSCHGQDRVMSFLRSNWKIMRRTNAWIPPCLL